ncbi:hypothetical protein [Gemmatimonas aurantiaca]|uniref:hypothetical protein n=1 Tax=Gemmatimonas aurantiaca TaxID=173480 RepID=UPI00301E4E64
MTTTGSSVSHANDCAHFEAQLGAWLEHDLDASAQQWMTTHRHRCAACARLVADLETVIADASTLPPLTPPRDLWQGIEGRLDAPVIPIPSTFVGAPAGTPARQRTVTVRWFAIAATLLVAVSSVVTWQVARRGITGMTSSDSTGSNPAQVIARADTPASVGVPAGISPADSSAPRDVSLDIPSATGTTHVATGSPLPRNARRAGVTAVANDDADLLDVDVTYEREISALRHIVDERFGELDSGTVTVLRRNLEIIDQAIADSRTALARDPRSAVVSSQLDRALQAKLSLMRRVALL